VRRRSCSIRELHGWTRVNTEWIRNLAQNGTFTAWRDRSGHIRIPIEEAERFEEMLKEFPRVELRGPCEADKRSSG